MGSLYRKFLQQSMNCNVTVTSALTLLLILVCLQTATALVEVLLDGSGLAPSSKVKFKNGTYCERRKQKQANK